MKPAITFAAAGIFGLGFAAPLHAELVFQLSEAHEYLQTSRNRVDFQGGELFINMRDGNAIIVGCVDAPSPSIIPPNNTCPLGTTGFIADGDVDGDGIRDGLLFYSLSRVIPALAIEPFRPEAPELVAAPFSELPRPLGAFRDESALVFYNVLTTNLRQYEITEYSFSREYGAGPGERSRIKDELVNGPYTFTFPLLNDPSNRNVPIGINLTEMPQGVDPADRYPEGDFRFTSGVFDADGFYLMDPRLTNRITWEGNNTQNTFEGVDEFRLSILGDVGEDEPGVRFPPRGEEEVDGEIIPGDSSGDSVLIDEALSQEYLLPPFFFEIGEAAELRLRMSRILGTSQVAFDTSIRNFTVNLRFVDTFRGYAALNLPSGEENEVVGPGGDRDGDGSNNLLEFAMQSDPDDPESTPAELVPEVAIDNTVTVTLTKRPNSVINYGIQVSEDGGPYTAINAANPDWTIQVNNDAQIVASTNMTFADGDAAQAYADTLDFNVVVSERNIF